MSSCFCEIPQKPRNLQVSTKTLETNIAMENTHPWERFIGFYFDSVRGQNHSKVCLAVLGEFIDNQLQYSFTSTDGNMINAGRKNISFSRYRNPLPDLAKEHVIFSPMSLVRLCNFFGLGHVLKWRIIYSQPDLPLFCNQDADSKNARFEVSETNE